MKFRPVFGFSLVILLAGCGLFPSAQERAEEKSPSFRQGYSDGCAAASASGVNYRAELYRDEVQYKTNRVYRAGWGSGYSSCRREGAGAVPGSPLDNPALNPVPGH